MVGRTAFAYVSQQTDGKDRIAAAYKTDKAACDPMKGNAKDICVIEAKGKEKIAKAELEVSYKPTRKSRYEPSIAKAEADYAVAKEKCDDLAGNTKDVCPRQTFRTLWITFCIGRLYCNPLVFAANSAIF